MQQQRFLLALIISAAILFGWYYLFPPKQVQENNANANANAARQENVQPKQESKPPNQAQGPGPSGIPNAIDNSTPAKTIHIDTPLYEVSIDSRGAVVKSWILKKNKSSGRELLSIASTMGNPKKLELVSPEGLKRNLAPLRIVTGEEQLDEILGGRNYGLSNSTGSETTVEVKLAVGEKRSLEFSLKDQSTGLDVQKTITFDADEYIVDIGVNLLRNGQVVPNASLTVGPNIGDQGVKHYTFYSVAPEAIAVVGSEKATRLQAAAINDDKEAPGRKKIPGQIAWAGVGDTYFGMLAVPTENVQGLEYRTTQYDFEGNGKKESRYLLTAYVPLPTNGGLTRLYVGPKDHYLLDDANAKLKQVGGSLVEVDLDQAIDYGFLAAVSRPIAVRLLWCIRLLNKLIGSYGISIIIFTIIIYSLFFPLKWRSSKSMKKAQKLAPKMKEIQEKIKGMKQSDPRLKELQKEQLRLMKEGNPLGGCLPLLIQMPFLFALYRAITISLDFRLASFLWLPDLSAGDPWHILEFSMAGSMMVLQLITPAPSADPLQRKMMAIGMPLMMCYMLWGAPSGLLVYWLVGNLVGFGQQFLINHLTKSEDDQSPPTEKRVELRRPKKLRTPTVSEA
jgi:YidC/Oxa1 family membrane protein insertase